MDDSSAVGSDTFQVVVVPVNDAPVLDFIEDGDINEDDSFSLDLVASDVDQDALYFGAEIDGNASFYVQENTLNITPNQDWYGDILVTILVSDGQYTSSTSFVLIVLPF